MKRAFLSLVLVALALALAPVAAFAQTVAGDGVVTVEYGTLLGQLSGTILTLAGSVLAAALAFLPPAVLSLIKTWRIDQLLNTAINYAVAQAVLATKDRSINVPMDNAMIESALEYALKHGSAKLIEWAGGSAAVRQKIIARAPL